MTITKTDYQDRIEYEDGNLVIVIYKEVPVRATIKAKSSLPSLSGFTWQQLEAEYDLKESLS